MKAIFLFGLFLSFFLCAAQPTEKEQQAMVKEGFELYRLELASWNAYDLLSSIWGVNSLDSIEGYVSYRQGNAYNTVFYGGKNTFKIYANFVFDSLSSLESAVLDLTPRKAAAKESELIALRIDALDRLRKSAGKSAGSKQNAYNIIPLVTASSKRVIVMTPSMQEGILLFGNDYVLEYAQNNTFLKLTKLHDGVTYVPVKQAPDSKGRYITQHEHKNGSTALFTITDICTLLLYGEYINWEQHVVISEKIVSIWDVRKHLLTFLPKKEFDKLVAE